MKKRNIIALMAVAAMSMALVACGNKPVETPSTDVEVETPVVDEIPAVDETTTETPEDVVVEPEIKVEAYEMSEEMTHMHNAAIAGVGIDNYWANTQIDKLYFEEITGLTSDMYVDFLYEMPKVSANVDSLLVVKPAEGQADAVLEKVTAFRQSKIDDIFQYPQNIAKTKGSIVEVIGDYVVYVQLGGEAGLVAEDEAAALTACEAANKAALDTIKAYVIDGVIPEAPVFEEAVEDDVVIDETAEAETETVEAETETTETETETTETETTETEVTE